jgi:hypothetical protein
MPPKVSPRTKQLVEKIFGPKRVDEAVQWLEDECGNNLPSCDKADEYEMERIRFAVLKLSKGDIRKLLAAIDEARTDWRDLFMAADFGYDVNAHETWAKQILENT